MARVFSRKSAPRSNTAARPGAARTLPLKLMSQVPVLGRFARPPKAPPPKPRSLLSPRRLIGLLRRSEPVPEASGLAIPFVSPVIRGVRRPIVSTAAVVKAAREARKPRTRWERLRDAARAAIDDPSSAARWERWMGVSLGLATRGVVQSPKRTAKAKPEQKPDRSLRAQLRRLQDVLNENAGPGRSRDRRRSKKPLR